MLDTLSPDLAGLTVPRRMVAVMARQTRMGQPTTREDFHQAEETCDLTDVELDANIGAAKRLLNARAVRLDQPAAPIDPWDFDRDYRAERVACAADIVAPHLPAGESACVLALRQRQFSAREIGALWDEIIAAARPLLDARVAQLSRPSGETLRRAFA